MSSSDDLRTRFGLALREALRERDQVTSAAVRSALAAIASAEAVRPDSRPSATTSPHLAGAAAGLGAAEVPRLVLSEAEVTDVVRAEIAERQQAAEHYAAAGHADRAARLRSEAGVLLEMLSGP